MCKIIKNLIAISKNVICHRSELCIKTLKMYLIYSDISILD